MNTLRHKIKILRFLGDQDFEKKVQLLWNMKANVLRK